jgi:DGQHR domain-containing protein
MVKGNKKIKPSKEEKIKKRRDRRFRTDINKVFSNSSFTQITTRGKNITFSGRMGEIDNLFVYENLIVLVEDTVTTKMDDIKDHLLKTIDFYKHVNTNKIVFIKYIKENFPKFQEINSGKYEDRDYHLLFLYSSLNKIDKKYQERYKNDILFFNYSELQYFLRLAGTINKSIRFELFKYLGLSLKDIGIKKSGEDYSSYDGFLLPESPSGFPDGYKIVSFLIEPERLLEQCYVLRKDGWQDGDCLYQRLLIKNKIINMRKYLNEQNRVFINNIIVTLPDDTKVLDMQNREIEHQKLTEKQNVKISIKRDLNTMGIIDGQHRVFSYHEGLDKADKIISNLRNKQHLLITGIIYPPNTKEEEKVKFEATLFLEINDKQSRAKGDLKQAIETLVDPYSSTAIAKKVIMNLGESGPLTGILEEHFYDRGKIKTTSIVSYGMKHIVKLDKDGSFFSKWSGNLIGLQGKKDKKILLAYIDYCTDEISKFISAFKEIIKPEMWTTDKKKSAVLTTITINGLIFCIRKLIENDKLDSFENYKIKLKKLNIDFAVGKFNYKSSHWKDLGDAIYNQCFK